MPVDLSAPEAGGASADASARCERRIARERAARREAERLLEEMSRSLYEANRQLTASNAELTAALDAAETASALNRRLAREDTLTGVANRTRLFEWLQSARCALSPAEPTTLGLLNVDLDHFTEVNEALGHAAGDHALTAGARVLREIAASAASFGIIAPHCDCDAIVARVGGDEFVLAGFARGDAETARAGFARMAEAACAAMEQLPVSAGANARIGASVGATIRSDVQSVSAPTDLLAEAGLALHEAKTEGRGCAKFFAPEMLERAHARRRLAEEIRRDVALGRFAPYYQPQVCALTHRIVGAEALARWTRSDGRVEAPWRFLDIASEIGLLPAIDAAMCRRALSDLRDWRRAGIAPSKVSVNVSAGRLLDPELLSATEDQGDTSALAFELLESMLLDDPDEAILERLDSIESAGIAVEIDDFGSGHASIVGLMRVRPSRIKLDRALVAPLTHSDEHCAVVTAIVDMARAMDVKVTAEGVETLEHAELLRAMGCDVLQGYAFGRPMSPAAFSELLRTDRADAAA